MLVGMQEYSMEVEEIDLMYGIYRIILMGLIILLIMAMRNIKREIMGYMLYHICLIMHIHLI
jgi:hypothetical protein